MTDPTRHAGALDAVSHDLSPPLRLGVIGCELGRARYGASLAAAPALRIAALTDRDERFARVWARELGGKTAVYDDAAELLAQPLDAVLVATDLSERAERIAEALRAGQPVLAETPFAVALASIDDLIALSAKHNALLMPALPRRFDPYFHLLAQELAAEVIGVPLQIRCAWSFPLENVAPAADPVSGGWNAVVQTLACQTVDLCRWWLGPGITVSADIDLESVSGVKQPAQRRAAERTIATLLVAHEQGQSTHQIARGRAIRPDERYILTGPEGNMELTVSAGATASASAPSLRRQRAGQRAETILPGLSPTDSRLPPSALRMQRLLLHFARCIRTSTAPDVTAADARSAAEIVHAAYVSTRESAKVSLPLRRAPDIAGMLRAFHSAPRSLPKA